MLRKPTAKRAPKANFTGKIFGSGEAVRAPMAPMDLPGYPTILDGSRRHELMNMERSIDEGSFICGLTRNRCRSNQENRQPSRR
jgi:hypothetical protein